MEEAAVSGAAIAVMVLQGILGIVSLVCWIMVLIPIFKENVGLGILGIFCGIFTFIYGWVKVKEYGLKKVMMTWTIVFVGAILVQVIGAAVIGASVFSQFQNLQQ